MTEITSYDDIIDSRDLMKHIEDLEAEFEGAHTDVDSGEIFAEDGKTNLTYEAETLESLKAFAAEFENYAPGYMHGEAAIRDSYFQEYAEQFADDIGAIDSGANWPLNCIDWEQAATQLQQDYVAIDFNDVRYWVR